jgi:TonB family protein
LQARVAESSGSEALDRASLAAARRARLPTAPAGLAGESFRFEVGLAYGPGAP